LHNRGATYFEDNDFRSARIDFESVIKFDPDNSFAFNNLASIALKEKDYKKAMELSTKSILLNPKNGPAYYNRGIASQMLRDENGCCLDWKKALKLGVEGAQNLINIFCSN